MNSHPGHISQKHRNAEGQVTETRLEVTTVNADKGIFTVTREDMSLERSLADVGIIPHTRSGVWNNTNWLVRAE